MPSGHDTSIARALLTDRLISREIFELLKDMEPLPMFNGSHGGSPDTD